MNKASSQEHKKTWCEVIGIPGFATKEEAGSCPQESWLAIGSLGPEALEQLS